MAMDSSGPSAKRTKLAPPATEAAAERSEDPPPGSEKVSVDRLSHLPDAILGEIISLLPIREGARTQAIAHRWRHLWLAAPLNLDCRDLPADPDCVLTGSILSAHEGPVRRICLSPRHLRDRPDTVDAWFRSPAFDNLQALEFYQSGINFIHSPPASIFRCPSTLRTAIISECHFADNSVEALRFPHLKYLELVEVKISEGSLASLITSGCPALERLVLEPLLTFEIHGLRINSLTLTSLAIGYSFVELIIENAPSLGSLLYLTIHVVRPLTVISAPKLHTLGYISGNSNSKMMLGSTIIQGLRLDRLTAAVRTVKTLAIHLNFDLDTVIGLMRCFPCLENLYMKIRKCKVGVANSWRRKHRDFLKSHDIRLKKIFLGYYQGFQPHVDFVTFFVLNARVLESIRLEVDFKNYNERYLAELHSVLQMEKRASKGARLCLKVPCEHDSSHSMHIGNFDWTNPFECGCETCIWSPA